MPDYDWAEIRRRFEAGESAYAISKDENQPCKRTINYRVKREGWKVPEGRRKPYYAQGKHAAEKHRLRTLKTAVKVLGGRTIDRRTKVGQALALYRADLIEALGGENVVTPQRLTIIDRAVIPTAFYLSSVDAYLMQLGDGIISKRYRKLFPIVEQRQKMADALVNYLNRLGLDRHRAQVFDIDEYAKRVAKENGGEAPTKTQTSRPN